MQYHHAAWDRDLCKVKMSVKNLKEKAINGFCSKQLEETNILTHFLKKASRFSISTIFYEFSNYFFSPSWTHNVNNHFLVLKNEGASKMTKASHIVSYTISHSLHMECTLLHNLKESIERSLRLFKCRRKLYAHQRPEIMSRRAIDNIADLPTAISNDFRVAQNGTCH